MTNSPRVLIIHEDPWARRFLARVLADRCDLSVASERPDALVRLASGRFDVVVTDVPVAGALAAAATMRAASPETEVILVGSGSTREPEVFRAPDILEYLADPYEPDGASRALQRALERKALRAEIERLRGELRSAREERAPANSRPST